GDLLPATKDGHWLEVIVASHDFHIEQPYHYIFLPRLGASYVCRCKAGGEHSCDTGDRQPYLFVPIVAPAMTERSAGSLRLPSLPSLFPPKVRSQLARLRIAIYYE